MELLPSPVAPGTEGRVKDVLMIIIVPVGEISMTPPILATYFGMKIEKRLDEELQVSLSLRRMIENLECVGSLRQPHESCSQFWSETTDQVTACNGVLVSCLDPRNHQDPKDD